MKKSISITVMLIFLVSVLLTGCAAQPVVPYVYPYTQYAQHAQQIASSGGLPVGPGEVTYISARTSEFIVNQALSGRPGTEILLNPSNNIVTFARTYNQGFTGWTSISQAAGAVDDFATATGGGNAANPAEWRLLRNAMVDNGWRTVAPKDIPEWVKVTLARILAAAANVATNSFVTFMVVPVGYDLPGAQDILCEQGVGYCEELFIDQ